MQQTHVELMLRELGGFLGLADLGLDAANTCTLALDNGIIVTIGVDVPTAEFTFFCCLDELDTSANTALMKALLEANYPGNALDGATLALAPVTGLVVMTKTFAAAGLDARGLMANLGRFIDVVEACRTRFATIKSTVEPASAAEPSPNMFAMV